MDKIISLLAKRTVVKDRAAKCADRSIIVNRACSRFQICVGSASSRKFNEPGVNRAAAKAEAVISCRAAESKLEMAKFCKFDTTVAFIGTEVPIVPKAKEASAVARGGGAWGTVPGAQSSW